MSRLADAHAAPGARALARSLVDGSLRPDLDPQAHTRASMETWRLVCDRLDEALRAAQELTHRASLARADELADVALR